MSLLKLFGMELSGLMPNVTHKIVQVFSIIICLCAKVDLAISGDNISKATVAINSGHILGKVNRKIWETI